MTRKQTPAAGSAASALELKAELERQYERRFDGQRSYRDRVWATLVQHFFAQFVPTDSCILDLGCGYAQFINNIGAQTKFAMDLNPRSRDYVHGDVTLFEQDCSQQWPLEDKSLDIVFTSNFLEHLGSKDTVRETLREARRCLRDGGRIICLGPNVRYVPGAYWDFWDHHVALSDRTIAEALELCGFQVDARIARFLPYTMAEGPAIPMFLVKLYLRMSFVWPVFGKQFLVVARAV